MARRPNSPALTPSHFKHFALLTVAATGCLALFANGEGRNELGKEVAHQQRLAGEAVVDAARTTAKPLNALGNKIRDARTTNIPLAGDDGSADSSYGRPMDGGGAGGGGGGGLPARAYRGGPPIVGEGQQSPAVQSADASPQGGASGSKPKKQSKPSDEDLERLEAESEARS